jgi:hypothetical protein
MGSVSSEVAVAIVLTVGILYPFFIVFLMFADIRAWLHLRTRTIDKIDSLVKNHQESLSNNPDRRIDLEAFVAQYAAIGKSGSTEHKRVTPHHLEEIAVSTPTYCFGQIKARILPAALYVTSEPEEIPMPQAPPKSDAA